MRLLAGIAVHFFTVHLLSLAILKLSHYRLYWLDPGPISPVILALPGLFPKVTCFRPNKCLFVKVTKVQHCVVEFRMTGNDNSKIKDKQ